MRKHLREIPLRGISRGRREDGQAIVEFVLILPFVVLILIGALAYGAWTDHMTRLSDIAQVGARAASVARFNGEMPCSAAGRLTGSALAAANDEATQFALTETPSCACHAPGDSTPTACDPGDEITVTARAENPLATIPIPFIPLAGDSTVSNDATVMLQ